MNYNITRLLHFISSGLLAFAPSAHASPQTLSTSNSRPGCGDYSILSNPMDRAVFQQHCGTNSGLDHQIMLDRLRRLDPNTEAQESARRGDFRLAAISIGGPRLPGKTHSWVVDGISCKNLSDNNVIIWYKASDVLLSPLFAELQNSMEQFSIQYNVALFHKKGFPSELDCTLIDRIN